jgi:hypothetical protein
VLRLQRAAVCYRGDLDLGSTDVDAQYLHQTRNLPGKSSAMPLA